MRSLLSVGAAMALAACDATSSTPAGAAGAQQASAYFDHAGRADSLSGGARLIPITTPKGTFKVWTKRVGNNPRIKLLLLHGGPAVTHEYFEAFDSYFPGAGIEYYYYDQLGSFYSDQPKDSSLWNIPRFVDEVEQVRKALGLDSTNFYLLGHSWGGVLAMEYALAHQQQLKGLIISNMMASIPAYNEYARTVLMPAMDQKVLAEIRAIEARKAYDDPRYMELLMPSHYEQHVLRLPADQWPEPVTRVQAHQHRDLHPHAGAERAGGERQARAVGSHGRPAEDHGAGARHRRAVRHDGPGLHGKHGEAARARALPVLPEREPPVDVRRPADLRGRRDPVHQGRGRRAVLSHPVSGAAGSDRDLAIIRRHPRRPHYRVALPLPRRAHELRVGDELPL